MLSHIIRKLLQTIPVVWGVVTVVFILMAVVPGDPARIMMGQRGDPDTLLRIRQDLGLDLPLNTQSLSESSCGGILGCPTEATSPSPKR